MTSEILTPEPAVRHAELLPLALSRPRGPDRRTLRAGRPASAYDASLAHQAIGIVLRDHGDLPGAIVELKKGVRLARASGGPSARPTCRQPSGSRWLDRPQSAGTGRLDQAVATARGDLAGRVLMRRAPFSGTSAASARRRGSVPRSALLPPGGRHGVGGTLADLAGLVFLGLGLPRRAASDFTRAEALFAGNGQELEYASPDIIAD